MTPSLVSARVLASGRVLELTFASATPPADPTTFVDHHRSLTGQLTLTGAAPRDSLEFAGVSISRGQDDIYLLDKGAGGTYANSTNGETVTVYRDGTPLGTIPADIAATPGLTLGETINQAYKSLFDAIARPSDGLAAAWVFPRATTTNVSSPQTYTIAVSDGVNAPIATAPITFKTDYTLSPLEAVKALRTALGYDGIIGDVAAALPGQTMSLRFEREGCPIWPIASVTVGDLSDPSLFDSQPYEEKFIFESALTFQGFYVHFLHAFGCRDWNLTISSSNPSSPIRLRRLKIGDSRHRWAAYWYVRDPAEVVTYGESLTVSGPAGLLAGANASGGTGDATAAFTGITVDNLSWAGPDGDLSPDLCRVTDAANGVDGGWGRWRSEAPPTAWISSTPTAHAPGPPMRIAYIDPGYDGSNGTARLNDPTRPYTTLAAANTAILGDTNSNPADSYAAPAPKLILVKKGTVLTDPATPSYKASYTPIAGFRGVSRDAPLIFSTYWMASAGAAPSSYATVRGISLIGTGLTVFKSTYSPYFHDTIVHGLAIEGQYEINWCERMALWDCVFPPHRWSFLFWHNIRFESIAADVAVVRCLAYDIWSRETTTRQSAWHSGAVQGALIDQSTFIRCGYWNLSGGWDGYLAFDPAPGANAYTYDPVNHVYNPANYQTVLPAATANPTDASYYNAFDHNIYGSEDQGSTPYLCFNTYSIQGVYTSLDFRSGAVSYGNCHYWEAIGTQTIGDHCFARRSSSHVRKNLVMRTRVDGAAPGWYAEVTMARGNDLAGTLGCVYEDNLILEPAITKAGAFVARGFEVYLLSTNANSRHAVIRHNTLIDHNLRTDGNFYNGPGGDSLPTDLTHITIARNLLVRTPENDPASNISTRMVSYYQATTWPGLTHDENYYLVPTSRTCDFSSDYDTSLSVATGRSFAAWQAAGFDAGGHYVVGTLDTAQARPAGGRDFLVERLKALRPADVTDPASALAYLRSRRPGAWDDASHAPIGTGSGIYEDAAAWMMPASIAVAPAGPGGYFGALDYAGGGGGPGAGGPPAGISARQIRGGRRPRPRVRAGA